MYILFITSAKTILILTFKPSKTKCDHVHLSPVDFRGHLLRRGSAYAHTLYRLGLHDCMAPHFPLSKTSILKMSILTPPQTM